MTPYPLSDTQRALIDSLCARLAPVKGMQAVVLGGSYARGRARPGSDIDLGLLYRPSTPLDLAQVTAIARDVNDTPDPVVSGLYEWGPWVNGGSWLTIGGQRVDFLYKNLDQLEQVIADAQVGRYEHHYPQQPPFGFYSDTYLAELQSCVPLYDPQGIVPALQQRIAQYPEALKANLIRNNIASALFSLYSAKQAAEAGDAYLTLACLVRILNQLVHGLLALNHRYRENDKSTFVELADCPLVPRDFAARAQAIASRVGSSREELLETVERARSLVQEAAELSDALRVTADSPAWLRQMKQVAGL